MPEIFTMIAYALALIGGLTILVAAFRVGLLWGLAVLFLPGIVHLIFIIVHWKEAKTGVFIQLCAIPFVILARVIH